MGDGGQCWDGIARIVFYGVCGLLGSSAVVVGVLSFANLRSKHRCVRRGKTLLGWGRPLFCVTKVSNLLLWDT